jgi:3'(2'), 5'-bisphosphate nucleotidase
MEYTAHLKQALLAVQKASRLCTAVQATLAASDTLEKGDRSPVTVADFGAQAVVFQHLKEAFTDIPMVGEEDAEALRGSEAAALRAQVVRYVQNIEPAFSEAGILDAIDGATHGGGPEGAFWVLDPIDGTKGFLRRDQYAVALALVVDGHLQVGVLGCPNLPASAARPDGPRGCLFGATRGEAAFQYALTDLSRHPVRVTNIDDPRSASFCESVESGHTAHGRAARIAEALEVQAPPFRIDSQCKYAAIARGDASIYLRLPTRPGYEERIWDHAAGCLVVEQAGGRVTDIRGEPLDFTQGRTLRENRGVVATNGHLHHRVIEAIAAVPAG